MKPIATELLSVDFDFDYLSEFPIYKPLLKLKFETLKSLIIDFTEL